MRTNFTRKRMTKQAERALIIFIRNPEKGKVKTRLAQGVGEDRALQIYRALLQKTRDTVLEVDALRLLFYSEAVAEQDDWPAEHFDKRLQQGEDLGARMQHAFEVALSKAERALIVGSDIAQINSGIIERAFQQLEEADYTIGPALDGGYYLLGMKRPSAGLFHDMVWSTDEVCAETQRRIQAAGHRFATVDTLSDIDYAEDWARYGWALG